MAMDVPLRLHFDVNKTVNFVDPVKGETLQHAVTRMLCDATWGYVDKSGGWKWDGQPPTAVRPASGPRRAVSYTEFLQRHQKLDRTAEIRQQTAFLSAGHPGDQKAVLEAFQRFIDKLSLDSGTIAGARALGLGDLLTKSYFLLPSFFRLLEHLRDNERRFSIVFRTFGVDLPSVALEFNVLCDGLHPLSTFKMPEKRLDRMVSLWRSDEAPHVAMALGYGLGSHDELKSDTELGRVPATVTVVRGAEGVRRVFDEAAKSGTTLGVRDMHDYWHKSGRRSSAGKCATLTGQRPLI